MRLTYLIDKLKSEKAYIYGVPIPLPYVLLFLIVLGIFYGLRSWMNRDEWVTLVHEQYSFSIDYPANWQHKTYRELGNKRLVDQKAQVWVNSLGFLGPTSRALRIYWTNMENPTIEQLREWGLEKFVQPINPIFMQEANQIGIDNAPVLVNMVEKVNSSEFYIQYFVIHGNEVYLLEFYLSNENDKDEAMPIFNRMLASFNILE